MSKTLPVATTEAVGIEKQFDLDPRPWDVHISKLELSVCDAIGKELLSADPDDRDFWTEVARRVNAHDDLVKALEEARAALAIGDDAAALPPGHNDLIARIDAALSRSKAKGG